MSKIIFLNTPPAAADTSPLETLLAAYGLANEREHIAEAMPYGRKELALVDVLNVMARMGYSCAPFDVRLRDLDPRLLPCAFVEKRSGRLRAVTSPSSEKVFGTAYIFTRQEAKDPKEQKETLAASGRGWFMNTVGRFRGLILKILIKSLALNIAALGMPLFLMAIYNRLVDITTAQTVLMLGAGAIIALLIESTIRGMRSNSLAWFAARIDNIVSNRVLSRLLQLPAYAIERAPVASQVARLRAFDSVREFFTGPMFLTLLDLPFTFLSFITLIILAGPLALIPLGLLGAYGLLILMFRSRLKIAMFHSARARSIIQTHHIELFEKLQALRLNGMSEVWSEQFRDISAAGSLTAFRAQHISQIMEIGIYTLTTLAGLALVYLGVERVWAGAMSGGALFASVIFFWRVTAPWQALASNISKLEQLYRSIQQIDRLMLLDTERESAPGLGKLAKPVGAVEFSKVGLRYSKDSDPVCVGLSFSAQPGEMVAIAGANGCGKTTLFKLMLGLYRPQAGAVYLDGRDIRQLDPVDLRKRIAYVPQIPELFEGTIAENLRFGNPFASDKELWNALEFADAREQVEHLSSGLDTTIASSSELLRSSLIYRLVLARAYVRDASLMLIDEMPYAVLNSNAGLLLMERIKTWRGAKTIFMVSHRDDHIRMSDRAIGLLSGGRYMVGAPDKVIRDLRDETFRLRKDIA